MLEFVYYAVILNVFFALALVFYNHTMAKNYRKKAAIMNLRTFLSFKKLLVLYCALHYQQESQIINAAQKHTP